MERRTIKLTESELQSMIMESIKAAISENPDMVEEGFIDNLKQGAKAFVGKGDFGASSNSNRRNGGGLNLKDRWNAAKTNYQAKGEYDNIGTVVKFLKNLVDSGKIQPQTTVAQLIGQGGRFGTLTSMSGNVARRGSDAMNKIYR